MPVSNIKGGAGSQVILASRNKSHTNDFSKILNSRLPENIRSHQMNNTESAQGKSTNRTHYIELGRISGETPTVSHILKSHPEFSAKCWDIIFSSSNSDKDFTKMRDGTLVALKPETNELIWGRKLSALVRNSDSSHAERPSGKTTAQQPQGQTIVVGTISKENPTVSHLFQANPNFDSRFWNIIHSPANRGKNYTSLPPGTEVVLDTKTMELSFHKTPYNRSTAVIAKAIPAEQHPDNMPRDHTTLADAVKPYIGTPYEQIDCYGLIVRGLQNQGIQYKGHGGIREKLEALAIRNGLPSNAYFSGEGLVEKAGRKIFSKSLEHVSGPRERTDEIYSELMPHLQEGYILSFSTPTQGHTGIVGRQGEDWTYINSGVIDNQVSPLKLSKGVGEEFLKAELNNWLVLAAEKKEPLTVTLGLVEPQQS